MNRDCTEKKSQLSVMVNYISAFSYPELLINENNLPNYLEKPFDLYNAGTCDTCAVNILADTQSLNLSHYLLIEL